MKKKGQSTMRITKANHVLSDLQLDDLRIAPGEIASLTEEQQHDLLEELTPVRPVLLAVAMQLRKYRERGHDRLWTGTPQLLEEARQFQKFEVGRSKAQPTLAAVTNLLVAAAVFEPRWDTPPLPITRVARRRENRATILVN
jgi:hypothetical protein